MFYLSLLAANITRLAIKILNRSSGTSFIGLLVLKMCPNFLTHCSKYVKKDIITVTGTNGKTTTAGIIAQILKTNNQKIAHNDKGANMLSGIVNTLATKIKPFKRFDYFVLESDEAYLSKLYNFINSNYLVVTNLFRDQLDRYGELDTTAKFIQSAIDKNQDLQLILNADDPIVVNFKNNKKPILYGFDHVEYMEKNQTSNAPSEIFYCSHCSKPLKYEKRFYAQQGHYYCDCGYKRPDVDYSADVKIYSSYSELDIKHKDQYYRFHVNLIGLYNAYNVLAGISLALELGFRQDEIQKALDSYKAAFGRSEITNIKGRKTIIQLIKNPTGASEVLKTVDLESNILIAINDNYADGRDISWLWDTDFEQLAGAQNTIITSGSRAFDMAVRLKYAGVKKIQVIPEIDKAFKFMIKNTNGDLTILPSYTALLKLKKDRF